MQTVLAVGPRKNAKLITVGPTSIPDSRVSKKTTKKRQKNDKKTTKKSVISFVLTRTTYM